MKRIIISFVFAVLLSAVAHAQGTYRAQPVLDSRVAEILNLDGPFKISKICKIEVTLIPNVE